MGSGMIRALSFLLGEDLDGVCGVVFRKKIICGKMFSFGCFGVLLGL